MAESGDPTVYFFALLVVICGPPCILLVIGKFRSWKYGDLRFEAKLSLAAQKYIDSNRIPAMCTLFHEKEKSWKNRTMSFMRNSIVSTSGERDARLEFFRHELKQCNSFWGIGDIFVPEGLVTIALCGLSYQIKFPPGLIEDWLFYIFNSINPLPFVCGDKKHPERLPSRFVIYCTSQAFALLIYLLFAESSVAQQFASILITPIVMIVENWLHYMLVCPCLAEDTDESSDNTSKQNSVWKTLRIVLRTLGGLLSLPLLITLISIFYAAAQLLSNGDIDKVYLAYFLWDGLVLPPIMKLLITTTNFMWWIHPTHINVCNANLLTVNAWTEVQYRDYDLALVKEESSEASAAPLTFDVFNWSCNCLRYSGYSTDTHYNCDICQTSCYGARCCDMLNSWYFKSPKPQSYLRELKPLCRSVSQQETSSLLHDEACLTSDFPTNTLKSSLL